MWKGPIDVYTDFGFNGLLIFVKSFFCQMVLKARNIFMGITGPLEIILLLCKISSYERSKSTMKNESCTYCYTLKNKYKWSLGLRNIPPFTLQYSSICTCKISHDYIYAGVICDLSCLFVALFSLLSPFSNTHSNHETVFQ